MATVILPGVLVQLFPGSERRVSVTGATVGGVMAELDGRWPGMLARICDSTPSIRRHILVFVDSEKATLETEVGPGSTVEVIPATSGG
jgi:molybdopterin converting factor small subunit